MFSVRPVPLSSVHTLPTPARPAPPTVVGRRGVSSHAISRSRTGHFSYCRTGSSLKAICSAYDHQTPSCGSFQNPSKSSFKRCLWSLNAFAAKSLYG